MIKRLITVVLFSALAAIHAAGQAQPNRFPPINLVPGDPTGTPCQPHAMVQSSDSGLLYTCQGGVFHGSSPVEPARVSWPPECNAPGMVYNIATNTCTDISHVPPANVAWPPSCTTGTYVPASNTCVPTGTAANPGGTPGQTQINAGGSTFVGIPGSVTDVTNGWKTQGGFQYAKGWQSGGGNNGIVNAQAANATVIADPSYATNERPVATSFSATPFHYQDLRAGSQIDVFHNPQYGFSQYYPPPSTLAQNFNFLQYAKVKYCIFDADPQGGLGCDQTVNMATFPGWSVGTPAGFSGGAQTGWSNLKTHEIYTQSRNAGITESIYINQYKTGVGDNAAMYIQSTGYGGSISLADESNKGYALNELEGTDWYTGTCSGSGCVNGSQSVTLSAGAGSQGVGRYIYNNSAAPVATGNLVLPTTAGLASSVGNLTAVHVDATVPVSGAWGTLTAAINTPFKTSPPFTQDTTFTITVNASSPAAFNTTDLICFQGNFHEQVVPYSATTAAGVATIKAFVRKIHGSGTVVMQGGMCGTGLEFATYTWNNAGGKPYLYLLDVIGSTDANTLQVGMFSKGATLSVTAPGSLNFFVSPTNTYSYGTTLYGTLAVANLAPANSNGRTLIFTLFNEGSGSSVWNNTPCTNAQLKDSTHFTCTIAGMSGTHTTTAQGTGVIQGTKTFNAYAIAEVTDVRNNAVSPPAVDGSFSLEPNTMTIASGDTLIELNNTAAQWNGFFGGINTNNPYNQSTTALNIYDVGRGSSGGGDSVTSNSYIAISAGSTLADYIGYGGGLNPGNILNMTGAYYNGLVFSAAPAGTANLLEVLNYAPQSSSPSWNSRLLRWDMRNTSWTVAANLFHGDVTDSGERVYTLGAPNVVLPSDLSGAIIHTAEVFAKLAAPVLDPLTTTATGGILAGGTTYCYQVQCWGKIAPLNQSPLSAERCLAVGAGTNTNTVSVSWTAPPGCSGGYTVFGRTSGAEAHMSDDSANSANISATEYIDTGRVTPSGAPQLPVQPGIESVGYVGLSAGANQLKLQAPGTQMMATVTNGSTTLSATSVTTSANWVGMSISGSNIPAGTTVSSITNTTSLVMSAAATGTAAVPFTPVVIGGLATAQTITVTKINTVTITPTAVPTSTCAEQTFTVTGLATGQAVTVNPTTFLGAHVWIASVRVSATNTLAIAFCGDATGGTPAPGTYAIVAF